MPRSILNIMAFALLIIGAGAAYLVVYGKKPNESKHDAGICTAAQGTGERIRPLVGGEVASLSVTERPFQLPDLSFKGPDGAPKKLSDYAGKLRLVNIWATWCVPCREEMPALDALQRALGGPDFEVMTINIDQRDEEKPKKWLADHKITALNHYADPSAKVFQELKVVGRAFGLPATMLIDEKGCEIAHMAGPADWGSERAKSIIRAALAK